MPKVKEHFCSLEPLASEWLDGALWHSGHIGEQIRRVEEPKEETPSLILPSADGAVLRGSPAVWQQPGRDMLFCLNPPHSLPFPHWPDGAPRRGAADVSLAGAGSSRTHLPGPRLTAAPRGLSGSGEVAANSRARTALGEPRDSGEGTRTEGASLLSPAPRSASRGRRNAGPQPGRARRRRLPFSTPASSGAPRGPALKRAGNLVYRPGRGAHRVFVWKVSISGCNVFLVN